MARKIVKIIFPLLAFLYIIGIVFIPFMRPLRYNLFSWLLFIIYVINVIFIYSILNSKRKNNIITDQEKKDIKESQELLKDRGKWFL